MTDIGKRSIAVVGENMHDVSSNENHALEVEYVMYEGVPWLTAGDAKGREVKL